MKRAIAVDWSGAKSGARSRIWLAEVRDGRLMRLESGRDRSEVVTHLIEDAQQEPDVVIGLDFAFSFPRWFAAERGARSVEDVWDLVAEQGEEWLRDCQPPFWGRPGKPRPDLSAHFRVTEHQAKSTEASPKSVFQIGGAGAVGTGSIRGMPHLATLRAAGFSIWPFHEVKSPLVLEVYPRLLTGPVNKSDPSARKALLVGDFPEIDDTLAGEAASSDDAFDAAISAVVTARHMDQISALTASRDPTELLEGRMWWPCEVREVPASPPVKAAPPVDCPFCHLPEGSVVAESQHALAVRDRYPVSNGHTLVIPRAHAATVFDQSADVQGDIWRLVARVRGELQSEFNPDGFNVGLNEGTAAGQTVGHAHVHVIPRFEGDVADPRGGIRWVLPERAAYWDE
ncbi:MAG: HIT domain-containing protein [Rhodospirillaceae bacterium]|nr:HIT domain-containing protein [Rhodospirillaceae bacterium]